MKPDDFFERHQRMHDRARIDWVLLVVFIVIALGAGYVLFLVLRPAYAF